MTETKTVPIEPTREMLEAGRDFLLQEPINPMPRTLYKAMLSAAPPDNTIAELREQVAELVAGFQALRDRAAESCHTWEYFQRKDLDAADEILLKHKEKK